MSMDKDEFTEVEDVSNYWEDQSQYFKEELESPEISFNALNGTISVNTIRLKGILQNKSISILVDSGSTHNFI